MRLFDEHTNPCTTSVFTCNMPVFPLLSYLDLVPNQIRSEHWATSCLHLARSSRVVSRVIRINTQCVQLFLQCVLPCPLWSSGPPPATFRSPHYGQTSWSGCRKSQDVPNKSSSSGGYCVMQCSLSSSCHHFVICDVVTP